MRVLARMGRREKRRFAQDSITGHATPVPPTRHVTARHVTDARQVTLVSGESRRHLVSPSLCPPYYALLSIYNADSTYGLAFFLHARP